MAKKRKLKFGIPGGALESSMERLFKDAGYELTKIDGTPSLVLIDDPEIDCFFDRANEITKLIHHGVLDGGIVSKASLVEVKAKVVEICKIGTPNFIWDKTKVVLAVPQKLNIKSIKELDGKKIITRLPSITKDFLEKNKISAQIEITSSSAEPKVGVLADAVVEFTNTGATLKFYKLRILEVLLENANIISIVTHPKVLADKWKKRKLEDLGFLLGGARAAQEMVGLILHASNEMLEKVFKILPALKRPTVTHLRGENWFEVFTVINKKAARSLIPILKKIGCTNIVEFPLNKVVV